MGVYGSTTGTGSVSYGGCFINQNNNSTSLYAGNTMIAGTLGVSGYITKSGGGYRIDHPQDPENKFLNHSFVESPEMMNIYRGNATLDANGEAIVSLPSYFEAANEKPCFQLTAIGASMPNLFVASGISNGSFKVSGGVANAVVSWQVSAARADAWAKANNPGVEIDKGDKKGLFLHPELHGADESKSLHPSPAMIDKQVRG